MACTDPADPGSTEKAADYGFRTVPWPGPFDDAAARTVAEHAPEPDDAEWADMMPRWEVAGVSVYDDDEAPRQPRRIPPNSEVPPERRRPPVDNEEEST